MPYRTPWQPEPETIALALHHCDECGCYQYASQIAVVRCDCPKGVPLHPSAIYANGQDETVVASPPSARALKPVTAVEVVRWLLPSSFGGLGRLACMVVLFAYVVWWLVTYAL